MAYASVNDVVMRMDRTMSGTEEETCATLLDDAAVIIDAYASSASADVKKIVSCRMLIRALGTGDDSVPIGAMQGSIAALGYSQSWTMGTGSTGELYISSAERRMLGMGNQIGSYSPVEELVGDSV